MFLIENGIVYAQQTTMSGGIAKVCIGNEKQCYTTNTDTQIVYQWQKFNVEQGIYEDDAANTTPIDGVIPADGKVVITVTPPPAVPSLEDKVNFLYYKATGVIS